MVDQLPGHDGPCCIATFFMTRGPEGSGDQSSAALMLIQ